MSAKKYIIELAPQERKRLKALVDKGKVAAHKRRHSQILLLSDTGPEGPGWTDEKIAKAIGVDPPTAGRVRKRSVEEGLDAAIDRKKQLSRRPVKIDGRAEAALIATACSPAPKGRKRWTLKLLADRLVELEYVDTVSIETVRKKLKKTS
jgi:transposase